MLCDHDILAELQKRGGEEASDFLIDHFPREGKTDWSSLPLSDPQWNSADSPIQPSSIDLHVGRIYVPGKRKGSLGSSGRGALSHTLRPGHSVIVSTYERISLPATMGGIVFPPSKLSSSGILVANIGHIDPGFAGRLRFTLINMGGSDFPLEQGTVAVGTLMLFRLTSQSRASWLQRHGGALPKGEPDSSEIDALAKDFADIESRIDRITRRTVKRMYWRFNLLAVVVPMLLGIALGVWTIWFETGRSFADHIDRNDQYISDLRVSLARLEATDTQKMVETNRELAQLRRDMDAVSKDLAAFQSNTKAAQK